MRLSPKTLFLIDGLGAITTAVLLSQVLARFEPVFGMPKYILFTLAGIACCLAIYSISCHFLVKENYARFLKAIAIGNLIYCIITVVLILMFFSSLTWLGIAYFVGEITIVLLLAQIEFKMSTDDHDLKKPLNNSHHTSNS